MQFQILFLGILSTFLSGSKADALCGQSQISLSAYGTSHIVYPASSPYPTSNYPSGSQCTWTINAPYGYVVQIKFDYINLGQNGGSLDINDGNNNHLESCYGSSCNSATSSSNTMILTLSNSGSSVSFTAELTALVPVSTPSPLCGQSQISLTTYSNSHIDYPTSSPYPTSYYPSGSSCSWSIYAPYGYFVQIKFESFNLGQNRGSLEIHDGTNNHLESCYGSSCNSVTSSSNTMILTLSNSGSSGSFRAELNAVLTPASTPSPRCGQSQIDLSPYGTSRIDFPAYSFGYSIGSQCTWTVNAPDGYVVQITFDSFSLSYQDSLQIQDGTNGFYLESCTGGTCNSATSSSNTMTLILSSYGSYASFQAELSATTATTHGFLTFIAVLVIGVSLFIAVIVISCVVACYCTRRRYRATHTSSTEQGSRTVTGFSQQRSDASAHLPEYGNIAFTNVPPPAYQSPASTTNQVQAISEVTPYCEASIAQGTQEEKQGDPIRNADQEMEYEESPSDSRRLII